MVLLSVVDVSTSSSDEEVFKNIIGTIISPNHPRNYANNEKRYYKILAPMLTEIVLTFNTFDVEYHEDCDYDYLEASTFLSGIEIYARSVPQDMNLATN